jgi:tRNA(fMet)-specific endonuclease VapC
LEQGDEFAIPVVVLSEFLFGIQLIPCAKANKAEWARLQDKFGYYTIERKEAEEAANLQVALRLQGRQLATVDALIATVAIRNELILLTTDRDFEPIPRLRYENWLVRP